MKWLLSDRGVRVLQWFTCAVCAAVFVFCIVKTLHWQIVWDQSVIRYVRFLMSRGLRPYSDITDMNMPGSYLMEAWGMAIFGWSDLSWRVYEYVLIALMTGAGMVIGVRRAWFTGVVGGTVFLLARFSEGERFSMERNEVMAMLQVAAMACFFVAMRRRRPVWAGACSALIMLSASIKPWGFLLALLLLGVLLVALRRDRVPLAGYLLWGAAGSAMVLGGVLVFLVREHALGGLWFVMTKVWPLFKRISPHAGLAPYLIPRALLPLLALAGWAAWKGRREMQWQRWALLVGAISGAVSFKMEGSAVGYHRYVFLAFLAMWIGWELAQALSRREVGARGIGAAGVVTLLVVVLPYYLLVLNRLPAVSPLDTYSAELQTDLTALGGDKLDGRVECLEMLEGCLRTLYEMRLVQNTGSTGDLLLFAPQADPAVLYYRSWYASRERERPADVVVLGNFWFQGDHTFNKVDTWPEYAARLREDYVLVQERMLGTGNAPGYRIYLRRGSAVLQRQAAPGVQSLRP